MSFGCRLQVRVTGLLCCLLLCSCASTDVAFDRSVERRATLERWSRCIDRQSTANSFSEVQARVDIGCDGHRRDVLKTYPPRMSNRLETALAERKNARLRQWFDQNEQAESPRVTDGD